MMMKIYPPDNFQQDAVLEICPIPEKNENLRVIVKFWAYSFPMIYSPNIDHMTSKQARELAKALIFAANIADGEWAV